MSGHRTALPVPSGQDALGSAISFPSSMFRKSLASSACAVLAEQAKCLRSPLRTDMGPCLKGRRLRWRANRQGGGIWDGTGPGSNPTRSRHGQSRGAGPPSAPPARGRLSLRFGCRQAADGNGRGRATLTLLPGGGRSATAAGPGRSLRCERREEWLTTWPFLDDSPCRNPNTAAPRHRWHGALIWAPESAGWWPGRCGGTDLRERRALRVPPDPARPCARDRPAFLRCARRAEALARASAPPMLAARAVGRDHGAAQLTCATRARAGPRVFGPQGGMALMYFLGG